SDATAIVAKTINGAGFYTVCKNEQKRVMKPARRSLNELAKGLKLLSPPCSDDYGLGEESYLTLHLGRVLAQGLILKQDKDLDKIISEFRHRIYSLIESVAKGPLPKSFVEDVEQSPDTDIYGGALTADVPPLQHEAVSTAGLDDGQKHLLYNMLIANGCTQTEAKEEIENLVS
ncbi:MAG: hypothetical protein RR015_06190, partial [Bacteroidales bacterium]